MNMSELKIGPLGTNCDSRSLLTGSGADQGQTLGQRSVQTNKLCILKITQHAKNASGIQAHAKDKGAAVMSDLIKLTEEAKAEIKSWWKCIEKSGSPSSSGHTPSTRGYSGMIMSILSELEIQKNSTLSFMGREESLQKSLEESSKSLALMKEERDQSVSRETVLSKERDSLKENLEKIVKVNTNLLELFIISVGGTPPRGSK